MQISALTGQPRQQPHLILFGSFQQPVPPSVGAVINQGTISADVAGMTITILGQSFTNQGTAEAKNGGALHQDERKGERAK